LRAVTRALARGVRADYTTLASSALACFEDDFEACIAPLRAPVAHRRVTRTTNLLERVFVEERWRLKIIPNGFGEKPVLKLMFGALIRARAFSLEATLALAHGPSLRALVSTSVA
jgi:transposase-like protein